MQRPFKVLLNNNIKDFDTLTHILGVALLMLEHYFQGILILWHSDNKIHRSPTSEEHTVGN